VHSMLVRPHTCEAEQAPYGVLDLLGMTLAFADQADLSIPVEQVERWPGPIAPRTPGSVLIVLDGRVGDAERADCALHMRAVALETKFRCVNADDLETLRPVFGMPAVHVWQCPPPKDASV